MRKSEIDSAQLGFDDLFKETDAINEAAALEREFGHLPNSMEEGVPYLQSLIERHHAAMMAGNIDLALRQREEAANLAVRLNKGEPGILAGPDAPGCRLAALTAAPDGVVPLWGQTGSFNIVAAGIRVHIEMDGVFGIGARYMAWPGFSAHVIDLDKPFISETGYRSFLGLSAPILPSLTPDAFATECLEAYVRRDLKGKPVKLDPKWKPQNS